MGHVHGTSRAGAVSVGWDGSHRDQSAVGSSAREEREASKGVSTGQHPMEPTMTK